MKEGNEGRERMGRRGTRRKTKRERKINERGGA